MSEDTLFGEQFRRLLGLDDDLNIIVGYLDRIERRLERLNVTPAQLEAIERATSSLEQTDDVIDAIEPEGDTP